MSKQIRVNAESLPPLSDADKQELEALANQPDEHTDLSDIPSLDDAFWKEALNNPFYKPTKTATTVRVDSDVLAWLKAPGKGYQTRLNKVLRDAMMKDLSQRKQA